MIKLIQLEYLKFKKSAPLKIMFGFYIILLPSLLMIGKQFTELPPPLPDNSVFFEFPTVWAYLAYIGNWLGFFFMGFLAVYFVSSEFRNKTLRQNVITGLTRKQFWTSKVVFIALLSILATLYYTLVAVVIGSFHAESFSLSDMFENKIFIFKYLLVFLGYGYFGLFLSFVFRSMGISLFLYLTWVSFLELAVRWGIHRNIIEHKSMHYYPMNAIEDLTKFPLILEQAEWFEKAYDFSFYLTDNESMIITMVYIVLFLIGSYLLIMKRDL